MVHRALALLLLAAPCSWAYGLQASSSARAVPMRASTLVATSKALNLKEKVLRAKMAAKGRHRLCVFKSNKHIYAQVVDDNKHHVVAAAATVEKDMKDKNLSVELAKEVGVRAGQRAKEKGVSLVYFDRNGFKYHGRVAAVADGAREAGLEF